MEQSDISSVLKDLPGRVLTASVEERPELFKTIFDVIYEPGLNPTIIKGICRIISSTLTKYKDAPSQMLVKELIIIILKNYHDSALVNFSNIFKTLVQKELSNAPLQKSAKVAVLALGWTSLVLLNSDKSSNVQKSESIKLMEYQSVLYQYALCHTSSNILDVTKKMLLDTYGSQTDVNEAFILFLEKEPSLNVILFLSFFLQINQEIQSTFLHNHKSKLIDHFIKGIISSKIKAQRNHIVACSVMIKSLTPKEFEEYVLLPMQRAMLRNPELILETVGLIVQEIEMDTNVFMKPLGTILIKYLHSKDKLTRNESAEVLKQLAIKCSDAQVIALLLKEIFDVLNGRDGKITVAEYRISLLQGSANLSFNAIQDDNSALSNIVVTLFSKILENEVQEKVVCHTLDMFSYWVKNFEGELTQDVTDLLKKNLDVKSNSGVIRLAYLHWFFAALSNAKLSKEADLIPVLMPLVDKCTSNQIQYLLEGACAASIILKIAPANYTVLSKFWNILLDAKQLLFSERFLLTTSCESMCCVAFISQNLLCHNLDKVKPSTEKLFKIIALCLTSNFRKLREFALKLIPEIHGCPKGVIYTENIIAEFELRLETLKIKQDNETFDDEYNVPSSYILAECLECLCTFEKLSFIDSTKLAMRILPVCHHPVLMCNKKNLWVKILKKTLNLDPAEILSMNIDTFCMLFIKNFQSCTSYKNVISSAAKINPTKVVPVIMNKIESYLKNIIEAEVSVEDYSLYYKSKEFNEKNEINSKQKLDNMEMNCRIEDKLSKDVSKLKQNKLLLKQTEILKNQIEKENAIKLRLSDLEKKVEDLISLFEASICGNTQETSLFFSILLPLIIDAFKSPLAASTLVKFYYSLHTTCFENDNNIKLAKDLSIITIRLNTPNCDLPDDWTFQNMDEVIIQTLKNLYTLINDDSPNSNGAEKLRLRAPSFVYIFQFLKACLTAKCLSKNDDYLVMGIEILLHQTQIKPVESSLYDPRYLPLTQMFQFILETIPNHQPHMQIKFSIVLLDIAKICSGANNCTSLAKKEAHICLNALTSGLNIVRDIVLRSLKVMSRPLYDIIQSDENLFKEVALRIWIAKHDSVESSALASDLWIELKLTSPEPEALLDEITNHDLCIQKAASVGLAHLLDQNKQVLKKNLNRLISIYKQKLVLIPPKLDKFNREIEPAIDQWYSRRGVALSIVQISHLFSIDDVNLVMQFMVSHGLGDNNEIVQKEMLAASLKIIDQHGKDCIISLLPVFQEFLDNAPKSECYDNIRQAVVILMGSLARHLDLEDKRIEPIVKRLLAALYTPSQQVQEAVSNCLPHLIPSLKDEIPTIIKKLLNMLVKSEKYGERRGAAYGIAGIVKGLGILSLKQFDIMSKLTTYIQEKKNYKSREGALFAFELLCTTLGRLFEPYIVHVLPYLLQCFGDTSQYVRQAADDTAKVVMGKLSAHGVKLILPSLLAALDEDSWRTKTASVELLGAMAFCAPKQLSSCLPSIVPKLIEVLGDSHTKVQEAGAEALKVIGSVIKNPEIQVVVPVLLKALEDPSKNTSACLHSLLQTKFVHFIDAPSLALIMPVVQRAFMDRSTETRKMAAQIIGNMYSLTDQKDLTPYLPNIIPGLKMSLLDPVPDVRAVSARALGAMVRGMGESSFEDLLPWLMQTLTSETSSVDRSGAAQGLSEVVGGLGVEKLHKLMPEIISTSERTDIAAHVKDGYIMMFIYMPGVFSEEFTPYIGQIINPILKALADENEYVRDTALKAGQRLVNTYAETAVTLLLPELEKGLFDENWRIRFSSVQLLGDLLYRISGVSGKMTTETASEDDNFGTEQSHKAIIYFLGEERRNRVLSGLYMGRSDVSLMVRQAALHIWKVVVTNTPRTLKEILPTLFSLLLGCLASTSYDKRQVAARTLGDLVRKLGERVLPEIIPILERGLTSNESDQRQGVCIGLSEIMASTSKEMVLSFVDSLVPTVRKALSDPLPEVREAAAKTFESLHSTVGSRALDDILPIMIEQLNDKDPCIVENTLDGLRQIMLIKSRVVLPYLVPHLTSPPINTKALSALLSVAGDSLTKYLQKILSALLQALCDAYGTPKAHDELEHCRIVILSISDEVGVRTVMDVLMTSAKSESLAIRKSSVSLLSAFCICSSGDYSQFVPQLLRCLLRLMGESDKEILQMSWESLNAVIKTLNSAQQIAHVNDVRQAVRFATSDLKSSELPGFCLPKGITPLIPVFREAILNGLPEEKENAAQGLGEIILLTSAQSLQSSVVHITGPLIRILGDRFNANVKAAVLETLATLLHKVGIMLKQFLPQLQTTFLKALHDQNRNVRLKAGYALSKLVIIHSRADPLFNDVHNSIKNSDDVAVRETMLHALRNIISPAGNKISEQLVKQIYMYLITLQGNADDNIRSIAAGCLGALLKYVPTDMFNEYIKSNLLDDKEDDVIKHGRSVVLFVALKESPEKLINQYYEEITTKFIISCIASHKVDINCNGIRAAAYCIQFSLSNQYNIKISMITAFARSMNHSNNDVKQLVAKSCIHLGKTLSIEQMIPDLIKYVVPALVNGTKEKNTYVRVNCEIALLTILRLHSNETTYLEINDILDSGARESLNDVVVKVLRKVEIHAVEKEELDYTVLV